jgi:hypothetical protein
MSSQMLPVYIIMTLAIPSHPQALKRAPYHQGTTLTDAALDFVIENKLFSTAKGGRDNAPDIVIVFTDGQSTYPEKSKDFFHDYLLPLIKLIF